MTAPAIILASTSATRQALLANAGVDCRVSKPDVDEDAIRAEARRVTERVESVAIRLACAKAIGVSRKERDAIVIGADQILDCAGIWYGKPADRNDARAQLRALRGRSHRLVTGACLARNGEAVWTLCDTAELTMTAFDAASIERYLDAAGPGALQSVGSYQIEGRGGQLFTSIRGNHFSILGLPLIPLLCALRTFGVRLP